MIWVVKYIQDYDESSFVLLFAERSLATPGNKSRS